MLSKVSNMHIVLEIQFPELFFVDIKDFEKNQILFFNGQEISNFKFILQRRNFC